jgi:hypothetical protein
VVSCKYYTLLPFLLLTVLELNYILTIFPESSRVGAGGGIYRHYYCCRVLFCCFDMELFVGG